MKTRSKPSFTFGHAGAPKWRHQADITLSGVLPPGASAVAAFMVFVIAPLVTVGRVSDWHKPTATSCSNQAQPQAGDVWDGVCIGFRFDRLKLMQAGEALLVRPAADSISMISCVPSGCLTPRIRVRCTPTRRANLAALRTPLPVDDCTDLTAQAHTRQATWVVQTVLASTGLERHPHPQTASTWAPMKGAAGPAAQLLGPAQQNSGQHRRGPQDKRSDRIT